MWNITSNPNYRPDIDGLRALAVIAVVLFHSGIGPFGGGFVGVDVFFVISGYLITSLLVRDLEDRRFSILDFYDRRIRRIFPALFAVVGASSVAAFAIFLPTDFKEFGRSVLATSLFLSNVLFWRTSDYFAESAELAPLLHTWSLAVEEQFYVIFPIMLFLVHKHLRGRWSIVLVPLFLLSLVIAAWSVNRHPQAGFYLLPWRAWELMLGALLAVNAFPPASNLAERNALSLVGIALIALPVFMLSRDEPHGLAGLIPCLGTAMIIHSAGARQTIVGALLASRALVLIGLASYSLYLWHWVLLSFARYYTVHKLSTLETAIVLAASAAIAIASWRFIEVPFRRRRRLARKHVLSAAFVVTVAAILLGLVINRTDGMPRRVPAEVRQLDDARGSLKSRHQQCSRTPEEVRIGKTCAIGSEAAEHKTFLLWGDSHAGALAAAVDYQAKRYGVAGALIHYGGCLPLVGLRRYGDYLPHVQNCTDLNDAALQLLADARISTVILHGRWALAATGMRYKDERGQRVPLSPDGITENRAALASALDQTLQKLVALKVRIYLVSDTPEIGLNVPSTLARAALFGREIDISPPVSAYAERQKGAVELLEFYSKKYGATVIQPAGALCDEQGCAVERNGRPLYSDDHHLSEYGARSISHVLEPIFAASGPEGAHPQGGGTKPWVDGRLVFPRAVSQYQD